MLFLFYFLTLIFPLLGSETLPDEKYYARRIQAHLILNDPDAAYQESEKALLLFPNSKLIFESYIRVLANRGSEREMIQLWEKYAEIYVDEVMNQCLIEDMAWGVLFKAAHSSSLVMKQMALLASFYSREGKGVLILHRAMDDSNYAIRGAAVKLSSRLKDHCLIQKIKSLFKEEKSQSVRLQIIEAIGLMKIVELRTDLELLIASENSSSEEKILAISSLVALLETINRSEAERLAKSNRMGLRKLACEAIAHFQSGRDLDLLIALLEDPHSDVRIAAYQAIGRLRPDKQLEKILSCARKSLRDLNSQVGLSAAWLLTLYSPSEGQQAFLPFFSHHQSEVRCLAAGALKATGSYGIALAIDQFLHHSDAYVRLNLALGLVGQRILIEESAAFIRQMLLTNKEKWQSFEVGLFEMITANGCFSKHSFLRTSEKDNQMLKLDLLNLLAILKDPYAQEAIRDYLVDRLFEVSGMASALLLTEGDEEAIKIVNKLLDDSNSKIRLQAAFVLAMWSREERAIAVLRDEYGKSSPEIKARILESLGRIGAVESIPFLLTALKEPSQTLRVISSMALIQCINH